MELDKLKPIASADVRGKHVLVRADLNVPLKDGKVTDATRLERVLPGLVNLAERGARVIVLSHFGRPKGQFNPSMSLRPIADAISERLGRWVSFGEDCIGDAAEATVSEMNDGDIVLLENLRFHEGEEKSDAAFAKSLARLGDIYVGDAFSCAHRAHASTDQLARLLPAYAGPLLMEEIDALSMALEKPARPTAAVIGGAKVSTKIPVLTNLIAKVDRLIIGGGMANTFLEAQGIDVGRSLSEPDHHQTARDIMANAGERGCEIILPVDAVVAREFKEGAPSDVVDVNAIPNSSMMLDVGSASVRHLADVLRGCKTLLWNGPMGAFEIEPFGNGTFALARQAAEMTKAGELVSVAGGGDTVAALNEAGVTQDFSYVSTAGGAFLEWLEGRELPGIVALTH